MTLSQAIAAADELKPHQYPYSQLVQWLNEVDGLVSRELVNTHTGGENAQFAGYDADTPGDTVLLVPDPYSRVYFMYLCAMIDLNNGEIDKYANSAELYNSAYADYAAYYNRRNTPVNSGKVKVTQ